MRPVRGKHIQENQGFCVQMLRKAVTRAFRLRLDQAESFELPEIPGDGTALQGKQPRKLGDAGQVVKMQQQHQQDGRAHHGAQVNQGMQGGFFHIELMF